MSALHSVYLFSVLGAGLFFVAGYLASLRRQKPSPVGGMEGVDMVELVAFREQLRAKQARPVDATTKPAPAAPVKDDFMSSFLRELQAAANEQQALADEQQAEAERKIEELQRQLEAAKAQTQIAAGPYSDEDAPTRVAPNLDQVLEAELEQARTRLEALEGELQQSRAELEQSLSQVTELQRDLARTKAQQKVAVAVAAAPAPAPALAPEAQLKPQLEKAQAELQNAKAEIGRLGGELQKAKAEIGRLGGELQKVQKTGGESALQRSLEDRKQELEKARRSEAQMSETVGRLQQELESLRQRARELADQQKSAATQVGEAGELKRQLQEMQARQAASEGRLAQLDRMNEERDKLKAAVKELQGQIDRLRELEPLAKERHDLALRVEKLKQNETDAEQLREEKRVLLEQLKQAGGLVDKIKFLEGADKERQDLAIKVEVLNKQLKELERLREEQLQLRDQLKDSGALVDKLKGLEHADGERQDLVIKVEVLQKQLKELEAVREQNLALRDEVKGVRQLSEQVRTLEEETASLRSQGAVRRPQTATPPRQVDGNSYQALLEQYTKGEGSRAAALADDMGLVVAGVGQEAEALAAVAAILADVGKKAKFMLPLGSLKLMCVVDENSLTVSTQPLTTSSGDLLLATMTVGPAPAVEI